MKVFKDLADLVAGAGTELGPTEWLEITQDRVNLFADATEDHQWIHVDPERAAQGPFGTAIAHGLLTLSLTPVLVHDLYTVEGVQMAVNYGYNKVRFVSPVPVGSKIRAAAVVGPVTVVPGGVQGQLTTTIEIEGSDKPACVLESIARYYA